MKTMNKLFFRGILLLAIMVFVQSCKNKQEVIPVAGFRGQQVTGVSVSETGRIFANFPRWRDHVENSVVEVNSNGNASPYPDQAWNRWKPGQVVTDSVFVSVQSVIADRNKLYVLDTRNALWKGVVDAPRIFVFDLNTNALEDMLVLPDDCFRTNSYINDLRVDRRYHALYMTDSNVGALVVFNLASRQCRRVLDGHYSTVAETDHLVFDGKNWGGKPVHSDGIALDRKNNLLYYHSLTGYTLYAIPTEVLIKGSNEEIEAEVRTIATTPAPDGMIFDSKGNLYMADLENNKIVYRTPRGELKTLCEGEHVKWADTFSIFDGYLFYTNSRINEVKGDISGLSFSINKIKID